MSDQNWLGVLTEQIQTAENWVSEEEPRRKAREIIEQISDAGYSADDPTLDFAACLVGEIESQGEARSRLAALERERDELSEQLSTYKRLYDLRGKALQRPCIHCGHVPAVIKPADGGKDGGA